MSIANEMERTRAIDLIKLTKSSTWQPDNENPIDSDISYEYFHEVKIVV